MMFFYMLAAVILAVPFCILAGVVWGWQEHRRSLKVPYKQRMREEWAAIGVQWPKGIDPALPPPTKADLADVDSLEHYSREHTIEMAVQKVADRASNMYLSCGMTVDGAKAEAMRKEGAAITAIHGWPITQEVKARIERVPAYLLLSDDAMAKLRKDSDRLQAAFQSGGLDAMGKVADEIGLGKDPAYKPFGWMDAEQKALRRDLREGEHNRTKYKKARQKAKDSDPWGAAKLMD